jgi:hypothetical protein
MSRRIFLDVGGHLGETLAEVLKPRWAFERIWSFEPATVCLPALTALADERTTIVNAGWWSHDTEMELHDPGSIGASVIPGKALTDRVQHCQLIDAARWMTENVAGNDVVWLKLNCEASEIEVLDRLLVSGEIHKVDHLLVHFDIEKVPGIEHQAFSMRARLHAADVSFAEPTQIMFGRSYEARIANWLSWTKASPIRRLRYSLARRAASSARRRLYPLKKAIVRGR